MACPLVLPGLPASQRECLVCLQQASCSDAPSNGRARWSRHCGGGSDQEITTSARSRDRGSGHDEMAPWQALLPAHRRRRTAQPPGDLPVRQLLRHPQRDLLPLRQRQVPAPARTRRVPLNTAGLTEPRLRLMPVNPRRSRRLPHRQARPRPVPEPHPQRPGHHRTTQLRPDNLQQWNRCDHRLNPPRIMILRAPAAGNADERTAVQIGGSVRVIRCSELLRSVMVVTGRGWSGRAGRRT